MMSDCCGMITAVYVVVAVVCEPQNPPFNLFIDNTFYMAFDSQRLHKNYLLECKVLNLCCRKIHKLYIETVYSNKANGYNCLHMSSYAAVIYGY